tara:strand:+ start:608 stop:856 length:249 start_codon:yes stop_codon:yes gene_type:complete
MPRKHRIKKTRVKAPLHIYFRTLLYTALFIFFTIYQPFETQEYNQALLIAFGALSFFYIMKVMWKHPGRKIRTISGNAHRRY